MNFYRISEVLRSENLPGKKAPRIGHLAMTNKMEALMKPSVGLTNWVDVEGEKMNSLFCAAHWKYTGSTLNQTWRNQPAEMSGHYDNRCASSRFQNEKSDAFFQLEYKK
jgi:hypothetical protein